MEKICRVCTIHGTRMHTGHRGQNSSSTVHLINQKDSIRPIHNFRVLFCRSSELCNNSHTSNPYSQLLLFVLAKKQPTGIFNAQMQIPAGIDSRVTDCVWVCVMRFYGVCYNSIPYKMSVTDNTLIESMQTIYYSIKNMSIQYLYFFYDN